MAATSVDQLLQKLAPLLSDPKTRLLAEELHALTLGNEPWKKTVIGLAMSAIDTHGLKGTDVALSALYDLKNGKMPKIDWADLEVASDILAMHQNAEADRKNAAYDFLTKVMAVVAPILKALLSSLI